MGLLTSSTASADSATFVGSNAATALAHRLPLYTFNPKDLRGLECLIEIVDVGP